MANLIPANLKITMNRTNKTQDEMKQLGKEITDLKKALNSQKTFWEKAKNLDKKHFKLEYQCDKLYNDSLKSDYFYNKLVDLEDRLRRNNLGIDEIAEGANESWEQCEEQLEDVFKEKLGLENVQIECAHVEK